MAKNEKFNLVKLLNERPAEEAERTGEAGAEKEQKSSKEEIMMIDVQDLVPSKENFYHVDDELKKSIEMVGVLQPLLVNRPRNGKYKVIAGHRRRMAVLALVEEGKEERRFVPCIYKKEEVGDRLAIIMANRFRNKSEWEQMMEVVEAEKLAKELKKDYKLEGKTRGLLSEITGISEAQIGRYKAIYRNLDKNLMKSFQADVIKFSVVSELCGLPKEWQNCAKELLEQNGTLSLADIKELKRQKEKEERAAAEYDKAMETAAGKEAAEVREDADEGGEQKQEDYGQAGSIQEGAEGRPAETEINLEEVSQMGGSKIQEPKQGEKNGWKDRREDKNSDEIQKTDEEAEVLPNLKKDMSEGRPNELDISISPLRYEDIIGGKLMFLPIRSSKYTVGQELCLSEHTARRKLMVSIRYVWEGGEGIEDGYCIIGFGIIREEEL